MMKVSNISKSFGATNNFFFRKKNKVTKVLSDISFEAQEGDCIALLGKNGSGKTTLLKLLSGLITPDSGSILDSNEKKIDASNISSVNSNERSFFWRLSVLENLKFFNSFSDDRSLAKIKKITKILDLSEKLSFPVMNLSSGERKKLSIARTLLRDTKILLLDEFTNSLDVASKKNIIDTISNLLTKKQIKIVIFATHSLDEVLRLSNRCIFLKNNNIFSDQTISKETKISDLENKFFS